MSNLIKICGVSTHEALDAAICAGADMVGFVRFPRSPRHVELGLARELSGHARGRARRVLLVVDPEETELEAAVDAVDPDIIQLHGTETAERAAEIRARTGREVMKAVAVGGAADLARVARYAEAVDRILLDAKPSPGASIPGGNGMAFDWSLLDSLDPGLPVMLSGGLHPANVADAIGRTHVRAVDVSSGVETRPGSKDPDKIRAFVEAARAAFAHQDRTAS